MPGTALRTVVAAGGTSYDGFRDEFKERYLTSVWDLFDDLKSNYIELIDLHCITSIL